MGKIAALLNRAKVARFEKEEQKQIEIRSKWHIEVLEVTPREKFSTARVRVQHEDHDFGELVFYSSDLESNWVPLEPHPELERSLIGRNPTGLPFYPHPISKAITEKLYAVRRAEELAQERSHVRGLVAFTPEGE